MVFDSCLWVGIDVLVLVGVIMALWCAIRTFAKHATELGNQQPAEPVFFVKPVAFLVKILTKSPNSVIKYVSIETIKSLTKLNYFDFTLANKQ